MHTLQIFQILGPNDTIIFGEILELYYLKTLKKPGSKSLLSRAVQTFIKNTRRFTEGT